ncbi:mg2+ transporter [Stagonosporopsis vannaccii]|nr:mg2+ transporter [Stagonosporopsis vannaccii]
MAHPHVDMYEGLEKDARMPEVDVKDFADTQGRVVGSERDDNGVFAAAAASRLSPTAQHETKGSDTIVLKAHNGEGYTTKKHIEDIYELRYHKALADAIKEGNFSLKTEDDNVILPSLWDHVVRPAATVQVWLSTDVLYVNNAAPYRYDYNAPGHWYRSRSRSNSPPLAKPQDPPVDNPGKSSERNDGSGNGNDEYEYDVASSESGDSLCLDSTSSESEALESPTDADSSIAAVRQVKSPTDEDGNSLVFKVDTTRKGSLEQGSANTNDASNKRDPQLSSRNTETISIAKAVSSQTDDRTWLQIFILKGPRTTSTDLDESIRWIHQRSSPLDFTSFKETCLGIPALSKRLQELVRKMFEKVEKEKLKVSLDGMFIEPGTVLRADESQQADAESVIFSCIPYFDLQVPAKKKPTTALVNRFPSRTLMQSYYPYEPVQDRDAEQAYRKFGNEQRGALVHVPNLWMVNIGSNIVATCGHQPLRDSFVQSIQLMSMDPHSTADDGRSRNIRLTDWDGRKLLYTVKECQSYFQMEQKLKELRWCSSRSREEKSLQLFWKANGVLVKVTPGLWSGILRHKEALFIDLSLLADDKKNTQDNVTTSSPTALLSEPFFQWPQKLGPEEGETKLLLSDKIERSIRCLEIVEKAMTSEVLTSDDSYSAVERAFTSTEYYRNLSQCTAEEARSSLQALQAINAKLDEPRKGSLTSHQAVILRQQNIIAQKTSELYETMHNTLALFVADVDKSTMLRKSWAAVQNICNIATSILQREPEDSELAKPADKEGPESPMTLRQWCVRADIRDDVKSEPLKKLKRSFEKCRKCTGVAMYNTSQAALVHAQKHFEHAATAPSTSLAPKDCVISYSQMLLEVTNRGPVGVLTTACQKAQQLLSQARELSDGVLNEDGQMSDLYTLPRSLLGAFRQLLVFYFAVERAMFYTDNVYKRAANFSYKFDHKSMTPFSSSAQAIRTFAGGVQQALASARTELCSMVKSPGPVEVFKRMSLSPEYICSWFMRRLIVKPLEKSMTVSDMYREYLSTIQFQVNHRPGKRLLRSINLLQEEIAALQEVTTQQSKLISNYMTVLDDTTYETFSPNRKSMFPYERMLLFSIQDSLALTDQEHRYLLTRCGPLSDSTKQSLEINEEDHGKAILVFTVVTVIFLPLSFVTSYLGMNTTDIRDMGSSSTLFWAIAIPLTAVTMGSVMYIGYNGDELRDVASGIYRQVTGKQDRRIGARGISVAQRKQAWRNAAADSGSATLDFGSLADEAEFANPRPDEYYRSGVHRSGYATQPARQLYSTRDPPALRWEPYVSAAAPVSAMPETGAGLPTQSFRRKDDTEDEWFAGVGEDSLAGRYVAPTRRYTLEADRVYSRTRARTYNDPTVLEIPVISPSYKRRRSRRDDVEYLGQHTARISGQHNTPGYEWTKQSHRHDRSTRPRPRRSRRGNNGDLVKE